MIDNIYSKYLGTSVSRETYVLFEQYIQNIASKNSSINLISSNSLKDIRKRHIIDCEQAVEFIGKNDKKCIDLGSGAGFPGIVLSMIMKNKNRDINFDLYEKSHHKSKFLESLIKNFDLNANVCKKDITKEKNLDADIVFSRAFKPLPELLKIIDKNFKKISSVVIFMGESGANILKQTSKNWKFDFIHRKSITNKKSFIIKLKNLKRI